MIDRIKDRASLTPTENEIVKYIRVRPEKVVDMSLEELSDTIYVSKSTIIRFCKKLGFHGHKELCLELAKEMSSFVSDDVELDAAKPFSKGDSPMDTARKLAALNQKAMSDTSAGISFDDLQSLAKMICSGKVFTVFAVEESYLPARDLANRLQNLGYHISVNTVPSSSVSKALSMSSNSAALFITYSGKEPSLTQSARILSEKNVPVFLISGPSAGTLKKFADTAIEIGFYEPQPRSFMIGSRTAVFFVLDLLYGMVFNMDADRHQALLKADSEYRRRTQESPETL